MVLRHFVGSDLNLGSLEEQPLILTAELSPQLMKSTFKQEISGLKVVFLEPVSPEKDLVCCFYDFCLFYLRQNLCAPP